ncbi:hypothetical protein GE061_010276 [Apolygus lucorum]|uniref:Uncharacterized protein n=1 Tax=Apolygus lucorum TaxID=248454 RepID=A0A8S9Y4M2_APOLU|nr:hypothetical protein GE061_010276 [Apolygus lucorum]
MIRARSTSPGRCQKLIYSGREARIIQILHTERAVTKLKYLLAESYTPVTVHKFSSTGSTYKPTYTLANPYENSSINESSYLSPKQEDYIQQLEKEGRTSREELARMLSKVRTEESEIEEKEKRVRCKHTCSAPNIVYESRISELEAQLTQSRLELRKAQDEAFLAKTKSYESSPPDTNKQIEALQRERDELNATISNLQMLVNQLRDKEASATLKVKRSLDVVDQAHFDKNQMEMEIRRLKSDLERMNDKQREIMQESARRVSEAERRYTLQIERLNGDLAAQWDTANRLNLELDRARRTESELRREISQRNAVIDELKKELSMKTSNLQTEALTAGAEKETLESELSAQKLAVERAERAGRQEAARLQAEVTSLRQRLDRADSDLLHSRKENLRLTENISTLEKEMELAKLAKDSSASKEPKRSDELTNMIKEMDSKHAQSVAELEGMIQEEMASLQNNVDYINSKLDAPNYENQGWQGGDSVSEYQNKGGGGTQNNEEQYAGDKAQYEQGPDKYLGDKTQLPSDQGQFDSEGKPYQGEAETTESKKDSNQYEGDNSAQDPNQQYQEGSNAYPEGYDPNQYPEGYDPSQYPEGYDPNQYPEGYDPNQYPEGYDPNQYPEGYDPNQYPEGYDPNQYPAGYDQSQYPGEYTEGYPQDPAAGVEQSALPTEVQSPGGEQIVTGVDSTGSSIVAKKEEFIPDAVK